MVVTRVILVWAALSLAAGAVVLYVEVGRVSRTVLAGKEKLILNLLPAGGNALATGGKFDTRAGAKVVLSLALPGQPAVSGRFSIPAKN